MSLINDIDAKLKEMRAPVWMDFVRMALGIFVFIKGWEFATNFEAITQNVGSIGLVLLAVPVAHYIIFVHMVGGALIALGAYTRFMSAANIPVLIGAIIFNAKTFLTVPNFMELSTAIVVLVLLIVVFAYGAGKYSLEEMQRKRDEKRRMMHEGNPGH